MAGMAFPRWECQARRINADFQVVSVGAGFDGLLSESRVLFHEEKTV